MGHCVKKKHEALVNHSVKKERLRKEVFRVFQCTLLQMFSGKETLKFQLQKICMM